MFIFITSYSCKIVFEALEVSLRPIDRLDLDENRSDLDFDLRHWIDDDQHVFEAHQLQTRTEKENIN